MSNKKNRNQGFGSHGAGNTHGAHSAHGAHAARGDRRSDLDEQQARDRAEELEEQDQIENYEGDDEIYSDLVDAALKAGEQAAAEDFKNDATALRKQNERLSKELGDAQEIANSAGAKVQKANERAARVQADWENFRKRTAAERLEEKKRATEHLIEKLLPAIDDLERAIEHTQNTESADGSLKELAAGVAAVHSKILDTLRSEGVSVIDSKGTPFDPTREQAVGNVEDATVPDESVAEVLRKGYEVSGKVIRPAMVTVTHGGPSREVQSESQAEEEANGQAGAQAGTQADAQTEAQDELHNETDEA